MKTKPSSLLSGLMLVLTGSVLLCPHALGAQFEDVTQAAGLTNLSGYCMGVAWGDYDNDGRIDLYLASGGPSAHVNDLYRNLGDGTFARVGAEAGPIATDSHSSFGCAWIDFNNDGLRDLFVVNGWSGARNDLYWNHGDGTFGSVNAPELTSRASVFSWPAFADYDGDGWVDVYQTEGTHTRLFHATGYGTFTPVDFGPSVAYANDGVWGDFDNDGDPDLFTCNYTSPSALWRNDGRGQFTKMTNGLPANASTLHAAWADYDNDGDLDIALGSFSGVAVYRNDADAGFVRATNYPGNFTLPAWADYDNDGHPDLLAVGGQGSPAKAGLFHNNGDGTFTRAQDLFTEVADYRLGCAWGDYDNDGFPDLAIAQEQGRNGLFHNLTNANHWIKFKLVGTVSNRDAVGAKVRVQATIGGQTVWQTQEVNGGYQIQNDTRLNFGLGDATNVETVRIEWPSGNVRELTNVFADQILAITETTGITPTRPSASLNGSVTLARTAVTGATYQWQFEGADLAGQTNRILNLTNIVADQEGRYSVVVDTGDTVVTNFTYVYVDTQFTKITEGPVVTDQVKSWSGMFGDYDGDGLLDLVVLGDYWGIGKNTRLYHNEGQGQFSAVTNGPWGTLTDRVLYSPWADTDNDGDLDLFLVGYEGDQPVFLENEGSGSFERSTVDRNWTSKQIQVRGWATAWGDFDNDGLLDAVVGAQVTYPLHNNGDGTFAVLSTSVIYKQSGSPHCYQWIDYDGDGDLDLFMPEEQMNSRLYRNEGQGQFTNVTQSVLQSRLGQGLNGAWADFDNDGDLDLYFMGYNGPDRFLLNNGDGTFADWAGYPAGLTSVANGMPVWGDYDNDGNLDLFLTQNTGHCRLFRSLGDGNFAEVTLGSSQNDANSAPQSAAWADYDNDGDLDLFVARNSNRNYLYENNGNTNHWLKVRLKGTKSNSYAVGARVLATARIGGKTVRQMRQITAQSVIQELEAHFGLGNATNVTTLRIEWPSGTVQELSNVAPGQILTLWEPPAMSAAVRADGACELSIKAEPNRGWQIKASSDLVGWQTLTTVTNTTVGFQFTDTAAAGMDCRFYRVEGE